MSNRIGSVKILGDLFLESQELGKVSEFSDKGFSHFIKAYMGSVGVVLNRDPNEAWKLNYNTDGTVSVVGDSESLIYDKTNGFSLLEKGSSIVIPNDGQDYGIFAESELSSIEQGTISIASNGVLTGASTFFTKVLRGNSSIPIKVRFPNSSVNTDEYEVVNTVSDIEAVLVGNFTQESNLGYEVIGAFTPAVSVADGHIYDYNNVKLTLSTGTLPSDTALRFRVAVVKNNANVTSGVLDIKTGFSINIDSTEDGSILTHDYPNMNAAVGNAQRKLNEFLESNIPNFLSGVINTLTAPQNADDLKTTGRFYLAYDAANTNFPSQIVDEGVLIDVSAKSTTLLTQTVSLFFTANTTSESVTYTRVFSGTSFSGWLEGERNVANSLYDNNNNLALSKNLFSALRTPATTNVNPAITTLATIDAANVSLPNDSFVVYRKANGEVRLYGQIEVSATVTITPGSLLKILTFTDSKYHPSFPSGVGFKTYGMCLYYDDNDDITKKNTVYINKSGELVLTNQGSTDWVILTSEHVYIDIDYLGSI